MMKMLGFIDEDDECGGGGEVNDVGYGIVLVPTSFGNGGGGGKGKGEERNDMVLREREMAPRKSACSIYKCWFSLEWCRSKRERRVSCFVRVSFLWRMYPRSCMTCMDF